MFSSSSLLFWRSRREERRRDDLTTHTSFLFSRRRRRAKLPSDNNQFSIFGERGVLFFAFFMPKIVDGELITCDNGKITL
jgi:hypothetical protein